jgi:hypothetical protein
VFSAERRRKEEDGRRREKEKRKRKGERSDSRVYFILDGNLWYFEDQIIRLPISDLFALEQGKLLFLSFEHKCPIFYTSILCISHS